MKPSPFWKEETDVIDQLITTEQYDLVVFNDSHNTFEHVIETLIDVCEHNPLQAEQCTLIIHHKGKCAVKVGEFDTLATMRNAICLRGISAEVQ